MCISKQKIHLQESIFFVSYAVLNYVDKHLTVLISLEVTLDSNLGWQYHLQEVSSKATKSLIWSKGTYGCVNKIPKVP